MTLASMGYIGVKKGYTGDIGRMEKKMGATFRGI